MIAPARRPLHDVRHRRAAATARKQRYRQLQKAGGAVLRVRVSDLNAVIETLLALRWLSELASEDRNQVGVAAGALLDDLAASRPAWTDSPRVAWHDSGHE